MGSSNQSDLFDPIRQVWVKKTEEEEVRQSLLSYLLENLGYPKELMAVECELSSLPLAKGKFPKRRVDVVCFRKEKEKLFPLLLVECKKGDIEEKDWQQLVGYNYFVQAPCLALVGRHQMRITHRGKELSSFPAYSEIRPLA